ncbi:MAG: hypothetical protein IJ460_00465 [Clostridia bacterium]|nr:hypothetical protein [Clostridia bacterium]
MDSFTGVVIYACVCSLGVLVSGLHWPRKLFDYTSKLFMPKKWELNTNIYNFLKVGKWKNKVPDMSKIVKKLPTKQISQLSIDSLKLLIKETCVAEIAHILLIILAIPMNFICDGISGFVCFLMYSVGNLPYIIIQRYNRPRLIKLLERMENKECES